MSFTHQQRGFLRSPAGHRLKYLWRGSGAAAGQRIDTDQRRAVFDELRDGLKDRLWALTTRLWESPAWYICGEIVRRHGGQISVESEVGKGSTFSFTLPAATEKG